MTRHAIYVCVYIYIGKYSYSNSRQKIKRQLNINLDKNFKNIIFIHDIRHVSIFFSIFCVGVVEK